MEEWRGQAGSAGLLVLGGSLQPTIVVVILASLQVRRAPGSSPEDGTPAAHRATPLISQLFLSFPPLPFHVSLPLLPTCASCDHDPSD